MQPALPTLITAFLLFLLLRPFPFLFLASSFAGFYAGWRWKAVYTEPPPWDRGPVRLVGTIPEHTVPLALRWASGWGVLGPNPGGSEAEEQRSQRRRVEWRRGNEGIRFEREIKKEEERDVGRLWTSWDRGWGGGRDGGLVEGPLSQRGSERRCSAVVSGGAARSRLELSHAPTSTSIHLPASASDRFLVWTLRPGRLPTPLPPLNSINNAAGSRLAALDPCQFVATRARET